MRISFFSFLIISLMLVASCRDKDKAEDPIKATYTELWNIALPNVLPLGLEVDVQNAQYLYVAAKKDGLLVFDKSQNPPQQVSSLSIQQFAGMDVIEMTQKGAFLYLALGDLFDKFYQAGLAIIDVSDPKHPKVMDFWQSDDLGKGSAGIFVEGNYAYLSAMNQGLFAFDISNKNQIELLDQIIPDKNYPVENPNSVQEPNARASAVKGNFLFLCYDSGGIRVIDISDKRNLKEVSRYINDNISTQKAYNNILIEGNLAYLATDYCGMEIVDLSDHLNLKLVSSSNPWDCDHSNWNGAAGHSNQLAFSEDKNFVIVSSGESELSVFDVRHADDCRFVSSISSNSFGGTWGLDYRQDTVYLSYLTTIVPFVSLWSGITAVELQIE